jgi:hypothetical protein
MTEEFTVSTSPPPIPTVIDGRNDLAQELEETARLALEWQRDVLGRGIDEENGALLRAQGQAAASALTTQIRADGQRLRAQRADRALEALIEAIRGQEAKMERRSQHTASLGYGSL